MNTPRSLRIWIMAALLLPLLPLAAGGQVYEKLYSFSDALATDTRSSPNKGSIPEAGLIQDNDGNFYGTSSEGGDRGGGTLFRMTPSGALTTIVEFADTAGRAPKGLTLATNGSIYGVTTEGGFEENGTIFRLTPAGVYSTLVQFTNAGPEFRGSRPTGSLLQGSDGNLYGTTLGGGANDFGTVFRMSPTGQLTTLVEFTGNGTTHKGSYPLSGLIQASDGNFYGTTAEGGNNNLGTIFRITPAGAFTTLVHFSGNGAANKGRWPAGALLQGIDGQLYGTTQFGGTNDLGTIFRVTLGGTVTTLISFTGESGAAKGIEPRGTLIQDNSGNFFGTTRQGGTNGDGFNTYGTVFRMTPAGAFTTLVEFTERTGSALGNYPEAGLTRGIDGALYGTTSEGGAFSGFSRRGGTVAFGTVFKVSTEGVFQNLVEFRGGGTSSVPVFPVAGLTLGDDGSFYGLTEGGGEHLAGTAFKVSLLGELDALMSFTGQAGMHPGAGPLSALVKSGDRFYGVTRSGGASECGTVFELSDSGAHTTLVEFTGNGAINKGSDPLGSLIQISADEFMGTTRAGGASGFGTLFKVTKSGALTTLVEFTGNGPINKGRNPSGQLALGTDGNVYGTTTRGGANDLGTIFQVTSTGTLTTLVSFTGNGAAAKGSSPSGLLLGSDGSFYGVTTRGGVSDFGTVYKVTTSGTLTTLAQFNGDGGPNRSGFPFSPLAQGPDGNYYGTTDGGTASVDNGTVFRITPAGVLTTVLDFAFDPSESPSTDRLLLGPDGNLYGTTRGSFLSGSGTIYRLIFNGTPSIYPVSANAIDDTSALILAKINARGSTASIAMEYGTSASDLNQSASVSVSTLQGHKTTIVGGTLTGLTRGETYHYRIRATNSQGTSLSPVLTFTLLAAPIPIVEPASDIATTSARFNGTVNANSLLTTSVFEWGTDGNTFPNTVAAQPGTADGGTPVPVSVAVAGFTAGSTIYYRLRATSAGGTAISGVSSFSTIEAGTNLPGSGQIGVTEATFRATIDTYGRTATANFSYWANSAPSVIFETAPRNVATNGPEEFAEHVTGLLENTSYSYLVRVTIDGAVTTGSPVTFSTQQNLPPIANADVIFYGGQIEFQPLANDIDPNTGTNEGLTLDEVLVTPPASTAGVEGGRISYNPQSTVRDEDSLVYRVRDPDGGSAEGQVRLISFAKSDGLYAGEIAFGAGGAQRRGSLSIEVARDGGLTMARMNWPDITENFPENFTLKGRFDERGRLLRIFASASGSTLTVSLQLDPDNLRIVASFEERVGNTVTASVPSFFLTMNAATGGLAEPGLRVGFFAVPDEFLDSMAPGFLRMTIGKDKKRSARFVGRLPDGEPFSAGAPAQGRVYELRRKLEQRGLLTGLVRTVDAAASEEGGPSVPAGIFGNLSWQKPASSRARFHRGGVDGFLLLAGGAYPSVAKGQLPPLGLSGTSPNARLRFSGGSLGETFRDLLLFIQPGSVSVVGYDTAQTGADLPLDRLKLKADGAKASFSGKFRHPASGKLVPFDGAFTAPFDGEAAHGSGVFRGPDAAGEVKIEKL